jgi:hypothetical protein
MRSSELSSDLELALSEYVQAAAHALHADVASGAEVELELGSQRGRGVAQTLFYSCRPLTDRFIAQRQTQLERLPEHAAAVAALQAFGGLDRYLAGWTGEARRGGARRDVLARGGHVDRRDIDRDCADRDRVGTRARALSALRLMLTDVFAEQTDFELHPERLAAALARLERAELTNTPDTVTLVATLHGLTIASPEITLTKGLRIATPEALRWAPEQALAGIDGGPPGHGPAHLLVALTTCEEEELERPQDGARGARGGMEEDLAGENVCAETGAGREEIAIARGREVLKDLLRALRLFGDGRVTLGPLAWARASGEDAWSTVALGVGGRPHGMLVVSPGQEDELRAFCNLASRRAPVGNELAWALQRFELGCERAHAYEALSDHLLALRALLEPEGPSSGLLAGRIAALCATPERRTKLTERMTKAQKLERAVIAGTAAERAAGLAIARDVADHLRALLRDVICGHLTPDLPRLADELLLAETADEEEGEEEKAAVAARVQREREEEEEQEKSAAAAAEQEATDEQGPTPARTPISAAVPAHHGEQAQAQDQAQQQILVEV